MKKGFTLVELSIVLVIIGLLISGLLVGQSMIRTSSVQAQIKQIQQIDIAVANFHTMYNGLPGDSTYFGGDGDGLIESSATDEWGGEMANFFADLSTIGFKNESGGVYTSTFSTSAFPFGGDNGPKSKIESNSGIFVFGMNTPFYRVGGVPANTYIVGDATATTAFDGLNVSSSIEQNLAIAIDVKIDDGSGAVSTGNMAHHDPGNMTDWMDALQEDPDGYNEPSFLFIRMGTTSGELR